MTAHVLKRQVKEARTVTKNPAARSIQHDLVRWSATAAGGGEPIRALIAERHYEAIEKARKEGSITFVYHAILRAQVRRWVETGRVDEDVFRSVLGL